MARRFVIITLFLWLLMLMLAAEFMHDASWALLPLYGLYPGRITSGEPDYHPALMHAWAFGAGIVFVVLGVWGMWRKSKPAALAFTLLFVVSVIVLLARVSTDLRDLH